MGTVRLSKGISLARTTRKLNGQARPIKIRSIYISHFIRTVACTCGIQSRDIRKAVLNVSRCISSPVEVQISLPGTTSRASMGSSYSMKPKPFMSLTSVMLPVPSLKWFWMSSLVTAVRFDCQQCPENGPSWQAMGNMEILLRSLEARVACPEVPQKQWQSQ